MTPTSLRSLAVTVEEREPNRFTWLLFERESSADVRDEVIAMAPESVASYGQAIRQGAEALARLARKNPAGPRQVVQASFDLSPGRARTAQQ